MFTLRPQSVWGPRFASIYRFTGAEKTAVLKAIATTGYAVEDDLQGLTTHRIQELLDLETLAQTIRHALDGD